MSLGGNLSNLNLQDLFRIIQLSGNSGFLYIANDSGQEVSFIFHQGRLSSCWYTGANEICTRVLSSAGEKAKKGKLFSEDHEIALSEVAFRLQKLKSDENQKRTLFTQLIEKGIDLGLSWEDGSFTFTPFEKEEELSNAPFLEFGLDFETYFLNAAKEKDEHNNLASKGFIDLVDELSDQFEDRSKPAVSGGKITSKFSRLKSMLFELNQSESSVNQIVLLVLRYASSIMNRSVLFRCTDEHFVGVGEFGVSHTAHEEVNVTKLKVPLHEASILSEVAKNPTPRKMNPDPSCPANAMIFSTLSAGIPEEVFVGPIMAKDRLAGLIYGDNLPSLERVGETDDLELFLSQAGIALEKLGW